MSKSKRDTHSKSRKGRPAINGQAMTAAQRKRRQRERQRAELQDVPSWLRLRQQIWKLVQEQFQFANADELANALHGVSLAITCANVYAMHGHPPATIAKAPRALLDPGSADRELLRLFPELAPYAPSIHETYPAVTDRMLLDVICDLLGESRNAEQLSTEVQS